MSSRYIDHLSDKQKAARLKKVRKIVQGGSDVSNLGPVIGSKKKTGQHGFTASQEQYLKLLDWEKKNKKKD